MLIVFRVVWVVWVVCSCTMECGGIGVMFFSVFLFLLWGYFVLNLLEWGYFVVMCGCSDFF